MDENEAGQGNDNTFCTVELTECLTAIKSVSFEVFPKYIPAWKYLVYNTADYLAASEAAYTLCLVALLKSTLPIPLGLRYGATLLLTC